MKVIDLVESRDCPDVIVCVDESGNEIVLSEANFWGKCCDCPNIDKYEVVRTYSVGDLK